MTFSKKPLHPYEQSMLLVAMLFDGNNLHEILQMFPASQSERMNAAKEKFLKLERNDRMTEIVLELRRLLLIDEHRIDWIHQTWIDDALAQEPSYLRAVIVDAIAHGQKKENPDVRKTIIPRPLVFSTFIDQLTKTPKKTAIYDPVLMRLQSLKDEAQEENIAAIGCHSIIALSHIVDKKRLSAFLFSRNMSSMPYEKKPIEQNPFKNDELRSFYLKELIRRDNTIDDCALFSGLIVIALYLVSFRHQWQRAIALGLNAKFGRMVEKLIERAPSLEKSLQNDLSKILLNSLDQLRR